MFSEATHKGDRPPDFVLGQLAGPGRVTHTRTNSPRQTLFPSHCPLEHCLQADFMMQISHLLGKMSSLSGRSI